PATMMTPTRRISCCSEENQDGMQHLSQTVRDVAPSWLMAISGLSRADPAGATKKKRLSWFEAYQTPPRSAGHRASCLRQAQKSPAFASGAFLQVSVGLPTEQAITSAWKT